MIGWASVWDGSDDGYHREVAEFLVSRGARHHVFSAIAHDLADEVRRIVAADPSQLDRRMSRFENRRTPLQFAVRQQRPAMVALLLELGADPFAVDDGGQPVASYADTREIDRPVNEAIRRLVLAELSGAGGARRIARDGTIALVACLSLGDGATSEGAFHEGATFAGVMKAPVVLLCNNNQWAISTPLAKQTAAQTLADKAVGYGIPAVRVDGGDVLAVFEATRDAVRRARAGDGPTFIEAVSYRAAPHATADDPSAYIDPERVEEERENECVGRYERYLKRVGVLTDERAESVRAEALELMRAGIAAAEAEPPPDPMLVFEHAYADPPPSLLDDQEELRRILGG